MRNHPHLLRSPNHLIDVGEPRPSWLGPAALAATLRTELEAAP